MDCNYICIVYECVEYGWIFNVLGSLFEVGRRV